jgi:hypothetical protein
MGMKNIETKRSGTRTTRTPNWCISAAIRQFREVKARAIARVLQAKLIAAGKTDEQLSQMQVAFDRYVKARVDSYFATYRVDIDESRKLRCLVLVARDNSAIYAIHTTDESIQIEKRSPFDESIKAEHTTIEYNE